MSRKTKTILIYETSGLLPGLPAGKLTINNTENDQAELDFSLKSSAESGIEAINLIQKSFVG